MTISRTAPPGGNPLTDHQHGRLTELIRQAAQCIRHDGGNFAPAVMAFRAALAEHFAAENIMGGGFTESPVHDASHAAILARMDAMVESLSRPDPVASPALHGMIDEMERILFEHELLEDSSYWETIRAGSIQPKVAWDSGLETGLPWVDEQHRAMVAIINELNLAAERPGRETIIAELMERFLRHARQHFAAEERQLEQWGSGVSSHRTEHSRLLEEVEALAMAVGRDPRALVNHYLRFWMIDHIRSADMTDFAGRKEGESHPAGSIETA